MSHTDQAMRPFVRASLRMGVVDLLIICCALMATALIGGVDLRVLAVCAGVRMVVTHGLLWSLLRPALRWWELGAGASDEILRAADEVLQRMPERFVLGYVLGWTVALAMSLSITWAYPSLGVSVGNAEIIAIMLLSAAAISTTGALMLALTPSMTRELRLEVSQVVFERKLGASRPPTRYDSELRRVIVALCFGIVVGLATAGAKARIDGIRGRSFAEQSARVALAAADLRGGLEADLDGLEIRAADELPALLEAQTGREELLVVFDARRERVLAAAAIDAERWVFGEVAPDEQLIAFAVLVLVFGVVVAMLGAIMATALGQTLTVPLAELREATRRMARVGDLRSLARVVPQRNDEIGSLIADFNDMLDMLDTLAAAAAVVAEGDLGVALDHPGELHDAFRGMVARLQQVVAQLRETALDVATASSVIYATSQAQHAATREQAVVVEEASENVISLAEAAENIDLMAAAVLHDAERSLATTASMVARIEALNTHTKGVADLLEVIRDVAKRSDLLALNGSLEATRAGEAGRGFALVAAEMRRLAERVAKTVADVRERVVEIKASGTSSVMATQESRKLAERTAEAARRISVVTRKQSADTEQASAAAQAMAEFVAAAAAGTAQTRSSAEGLQIQVGELERLTREFEIRGAGE